MAAIIVGPTNWQENEYVSTLVQTASLGDPVRGGYLICRSGGTAWIVAPASSEVTRTWYCRNDAVTTATNCTSATGWFVPTCFQLKNPGYTCRTYWDSYSSAFYWSDTQYNEGYSGGVFLTTGSASASLKSDPHCVRAFRCVCY